jgi:hypothetical protein
MKKTDVIPGRAYQMTSGNYVLPELLPLAYGEGMIEFLDIDDFDQPSQYYEAMKAQCALIEEVFESEDQLNEAATFSEDGWSFYSDHPLVLQEFAEIWKDERASDECLFHFFRESVAEEFRRFQKQYSKYDLDDVAEACKGQYVLIPDEKAGAYWKRLPQGSEGPVRVQSAVEEETEDGSEY